MNKNRTPAGIADRVLGYDVFISFAMGASPRGTQSYASDLARRLREDKRTVYFCEDEPLGRRLTPNLLTALKRARTLLVIVNPATLIEPRWVKMEVESFRKMHPSRSVILINADCAMQGANLESADHAWLGGSDQVWIDETHAAVDSGIVYSSVIEGLVRTLARRRSQIAWSWIIRSSILLLISMTVLSWWKTIDARNSLKSSIARQLVAESAVMQASSMPQAQERSLQFLLAANAIAPGPSVNGALWSALNEQRDLERIWGTSQPVNAIAFDTQTMQIVSTHPNGTIQRWDASTGRSLGPPSGTSVADQSASILSVSLSGDGSLLVTGSSRGDLSFWNPKDGSELSSTRLHDGNMITSLAVSANGSRVVTGGSDGKIILSDALSKKQAGQTAAHERYVGSLAYGLDGKLIVSGGADGMVKVWRVQKDGKLDLWRTFKHVKANTVSAVAMIPGSDLIISGGDDKTVRVWSLNANNEAGPEAQIDEDVSSLAINHGKTEIAVGGSKGTVYVLELHIKQNNKTGGVETNTKEKNRFRWGSSAVKGLSYWANDTFLVAGSSNATLRVWRAAGTRAFPIALDGHTKGVNSVWISPDGKDLVSADDNGVVMLRGLDDPIATASSFQAIPPDVVMSAVLDQGGKTIIAAGYGGLMTWPRDAKKGQAATLWDPARLYTMASNHDASWLAGGGFDRMLRAWNAKTGRQIELPDSPSFGSLTAIAITKDGSRILSGDSSGKLRLWDANTRKPLHLPFTGHAPGNNSQINAVTFDPTGKRAASASADKKLLMWDVASGKMIETVLPMAHEDKIVNSVVFSADDQLLFSGGDDGKIRIWNAQSGAPQATITTNARRVTAVALSPDQRTIVIGTSGGEGDRLQLWPGPARWHELLCAKLTRNISPDNWARLVGNGIKFHSSCPGLPPESPPPPEGTLYNPNIR